MRINTKIRAGALQFVLLVGAVIAVLLLTFTLLHQTHVLFDQKTSKTIAVIKKVDLGLNYAMRQDIPINDSIILKMPSDDGIAVSVFKSYWGVFEKYGIKSRFKKTVFVKTALVGGAVDEQFPALYLKDNDRPMIIAGSAKITGNAYLPEQGIRPGTIGGQFYRFNSPIYGIVKRSSRTFPTINGSLKNHVKQLSNSGNGDFRGSDVHFSQGLKLTNSFEFPTQYIQGDVIRLSNVELRGNISIMASQQIAVSRDSHLKDVVLVAPKIIIETGFKGTLQCMATESIEVENRVILEYPSALVVHRGNTSNPKSQSEPNIQIGKNVSVKGIVAYLDETDEGNFFPQVQIEVNTTVFGELYCEKNLELKGEVIGNVTTDAFIALENGSVYQNHLFNGTINATLLPTAYAGLLLQKEKTLAKWLY
ncbi:hypothetical protein LV716_18355 [Flagellimonas sp. HMM57]|uniref:hypothetical protein n=1 Tax=unclassified Flagellimonas TaxID=2644544 RepID=UPI0013D2BE22|nr:MULTISPECIES: hypothetical protein [unclassified Flagellimonas]UII76202.1 hypothetical protein LV716_18355 [Flagellimonas sp. HMM57]